MDISFHDLPPSKRFKLQHQHLFDLNTVPSLDPNPSPTTANKRVWAPLTLSPLTSPTKKNQSLIHEPDDVNEDCDDDGVMCAVCRSSDGEKFNPIVFCDGCDLAVHALCYGNPLWGSVPEGNWFCLPCSWSVQAQCCLCPSPGGAVKPTKDGRWAHIACAFYVPEAFFEDSEGRDNIDCSGIPGSRWGKQCCVCGKGEGCSIKCSDAGCKLRFHVSCGLENELWMELREGKRAAIVVAFCKDHSEEKLTGKFKIVAEEEESKRKAN